MIVVALIEVVVVFVFILLVILLLLILAHRLIVSTQRATHLRGVDGEVISQIHDSVGCGG